MQDEYRDKIEETYRELRRIKSKVNRLQNSRRSSQYLSDIKAFKNYAVILAYGCIENTVKHLIADYYKKPGMPIKCQQFAVDLIENSYSLSIKKEIFNKFLKKDCSVKWFDELKRRETLQLKDRRSSRFTISQMYLAVDFIFEERCKFAHGESSYQGTINELVDNFVKAKCWMYELDSIISNPRFEG